MLITYTTTDSPKVIEFLLDGIVLGDITHSKGKFVVSFWFGTHRKIEKKEEFDDIEDAKLSVSNRIKELMCIEKYKPEAQLRYMKEIIYQLVKKNPHFSWFDMGMMWSHEEVVVGILKEMMPNICPKCGNNDFISVTGNIIWCNTCGEHVEVEMKKGDVPEGDGQSIVEFEKLSNGHYKINKGEEEVGEYWETNDGGYILEIDVSEKSPGMRMQRVFATEKKVRQFVLSELG